MQLDKKKYVAGDDSSDDSYDDGTGQIVPTNGSIVEAIFVMERRIKNNNCTDMIDSRSSVPNSRTKN